jgi:hypothetical protein
MQTPLIPRNGDERKNISIAILGHLLQGRWHHPFSLGIQAIEIVVITDGAVAVYFNK